MLSNCGVGDDSGESLRLQGDQRKSTLGTHWKTEAEALILWSPDVKSQLTGKDPDAEKD